MARKTVIVYVGCGGVFWHGLTRMVQFLERRGAYESVVILVDDDDVEESNLARQYSGRMVGRLKVGAAADVLATMSLAEVHPIKMRVEKKNDLELVVDQVLQKDEDPGRLVVVHAPDNHLCRKVVHDGCKKLALRWDGVEVIEVVGGNDEDTGYGYVCRMIADEDRILELDGDYEIRHPEIAEEAKLERKALADPESCNRMAPEQSVESNGLTAWCMWTAAEAAAVAKMVGEVYWYVDSTYAEHGVDDGVIKVVKKLTSLDEEVDDEK